MKLAPGICDEGAGLVAAFNKHNVNLFFDFSLTVEAAPHECVIRTGQP